MTAPILSTTGTQSILHTDRELVMLFIDVQSGAVGIETAVRKAKEILLK